jgi:hypothetical protein
MTPPACRPGHQCPVSEAMAGRPDNFRKTLALHQIASLLPPSTDAPDSLTCGTVPLRLISRDGRQIRPERAEPLFCAVGTRPGCPVFARRLWLVKDRGQDGRNAATCGAVPMRGPGQAATTAGTLTLSTRPPGGPARFGLVHRQGCRERPRAA